MPYEHNLLKPSGVDILKPCNLFPITDAAFQYRNLVFLVVLQFLCFFPKHDNHLTIPNTKADYSDNIFFKIL